MTNKLDDAVTYAKTVLPETAQDTVAADIRSYIKWHEGMNSDLAKSEKEFHAGEGIPADKAVKSLKRQHKKYGV